VHAHQPQVERSDFGMKSLGQNIFLTLTRWLQPHFPPDANHALWLIGNG
jgi:hypothetical protein